MTSALTQKIQESEDRLVKLEDKYINNLIDRAYQRMRPIYQKEFQQLKANGLKKVDNSKMECYVSPLTSFKTLCQFANGCAETDAGEFDIWLEDFYKKIETSNTSRVGDNLGFRRI